MNHRARDRASPASARSVATTAPTYAGRKPAILLIPMNALSSSFRSFTVITALVLSSCAAAAAETPRVDRAAELLAMHGNVPLTSATRHVERGTYRVQVAAKLGRPDAALPDGTWLYHGRRIANSDATGTLVVRFDGGRVGSLALVTPAVATAMIERSRADRGRTILANK